MLNRIVLVVVFVPIAIVLVALAVANRGPAAFTLDPFNPGNPALTLHMPLFVLMFTCLIAGLLIGSAVTWWKQGRYRKLARRREQEAEALRASTRKSAPASPLPALERPAA